MKIINDYHTEERRRDLKHRRCIPCAIVWFGLLTGYIFAAWWAWS